MANEFFTLIVVPNAKTRFRKVHVPVRLARRVAAGLGASVLVLCGLAAHYVHMNLRAHEVHNLRAANTVLASQSLEYQRLADGLKTRLSHLQGTVTELGAVAGVEFADASASGGGVGGATSSEPWPPSTDLRNYLAQMDREMTTLGERSSRLAAFYGEQKELLTSTPSIWPVRGFLSTPFGNRLDPFTGRPDFHSGVDISTATGTPVQAPAEGTVIFAGIKGPYGKTVVISHGFGIVTQYGHLDRFDVNVGRKLKRGDVLGSVGSTGRSTGPHLHYEVWVHDQARNPVQYVGDHRRNAG